MNGSAIVFLLWPNSRSCPVRAAADVFRHTEFVCVLLANCTGNNEKEPDSADEMVRRSLCVDVVRCAMASRAYLAVCASACVCMSENCVMLSSADAIYASCCCCFNAFFVRFFVFGYSHFMPNYRHNCYTGQSGPRARSTQNPNI